MQLILEAERTDNNIVNYKMSVDQETVSEKIQNGDVHSNGTGDVIKADKENKECNENITTSEIVTSSDQKDKTDIIEETINQDTIVANISDEIASKENAINGEHKEESQNEDIQLANITPVASECINEEDKNNSESKKEAEDNKKEEINEDKRDSSECGSLKDDQVSKGNESLENVSNEEIVLDEPLRFEDDDSLESKVAEEINSEVLNPTPSTENIDITLTESDSTENPGNKTESTEKTINETELSETLKNEIDLVETQKNETVSHYAQKNEIDSTETLKDETISPGTQNNEVHSTETKKNEVDLIDNQKNGSSETDSTEIQKEVEINEKISDVAMECDVSLENKTKAEINKDLDNVAVKIEGKELLTTNDENNLSETPMECDDIFSTSQDKEADDKSTTLPKVVDQVPITYSKSVNDVFDEVEAEPSIKEEPSVTGSNDTVDSNKSLEEPLNKNKDYPPVSDVVSNSDEVVDESMSNENKKSEVKHKIIEKVTVEVPDSSTECNDISIVSDGVEQQVIDKSDEPVTVDLDEIDDQQDEALPQIKETKVEQNLSEPVCRLSNNLNILSDDEDEPSNEQSIPKPAESVEKCIDLLDDDDIVLIDEDTTAKNEESETVVTKMDVEDLVNKTDAADKEPATDKEPTEGKTDSEDPKLDVDPVDKILDEEIDKLKKSKPLLPKDFFKSYKKNLTEMTRNELEEFCILKIVESIIDRSKLNDIRTKLKSMAAHMEEHKKKTQALSKQNRDLQVILKSVQEEQKKKGDAAISPLRITRSVGMQVLMTEKSIRRKGPITATNVAGPSNLQVSVNNKTNQSPKTQVRSQPNRNIPVPKLVLANATTGKPQTPTQSNVKNVRTNSSPNVVKNQSPGKPEKRTHSQCATVDLTDDEPPAKVVQRLPAGGAVRMVSPQNLFKAHQPAATSTASPRKVYIPIVQGQVRPGQMMVKNGPVPGARPRQQVPMVRVAQFAARPRVVTPRHPAPLPDTIKQYQPPNWKALPPAPDLKLSKVENGIVISWKIEGYLEDSYEEIASYQLYAYQETTAPPNTLLWKKIGDVKALPLPMACTLTQFMAGYKYYFAVRAVDIRSRLGPFSLPGSILLLNKNF